MSATGRGAPAQFATADREIVISRVISAPREPVFEAFTEVRHLSQWWGPEGFTTTTRAFEFRVGGEWDFVMHGPDGTDYQEWISWTEIAPPERIALLHGESRGDPNAFESVQGLPWQASLEGKDGAAGFPHADVLGRGKAPLAQVADHADQTQLVIDGLPGSWDQLDDELLAASGNSKGRTGLPLQRLIGDPHAVNARESRHHAQEPPIMLS
jgi:uncharacterized protein YndB with AHSA1/START domain